MTEKRFTFKTKTRGNQAYTQWYDNEKPINSAHKVIDLLNELHEENQHLKGALKELKEIGDYQEMRIQELDDENEQLIYALNQRTEQCDKLHEENEQLKRQNKELEKFRYSIFQKMNELIL